MRATGLVLSDGVVRFGDRVGVRGIHLAVARGERLALLGPSGAGKTSLLRALAGLDSLATGTLVVDGVDVTSWSPERRRVVYLHQTPALFPHLSVLDNVAFPMTLRGVARQEARRRASALLETLHLGALAGRPPLGLSGGERHRTALARALAAEPAVLLLDEPFAALDPSLRAEVRQAVLDMLADRNGPAVIVVTHDVDEAAQLGDHIAVLLDGRIAQHDAPSDLLRRPGSVAVARFLGMPNFVPGARDHCGEWRCALDRLGVSGANDTEVAVGWADLIAVGPPDGNGKRGIVTAVEHRGLGRVVRCRVGALEVVGIADADTPCQTGDAVAVRLRSRGPHVLPIDATFPPSA